MRGRRRERDRDLTCRYVNLLVLKMEEGHTR